MALDILPIQASAVSCECIFSLSKETCDAHHSWIDPILMEALQLLKYYICQGETLNFMKDTSQVAEEAEIAKEM